MTPPLTMEEAARRRHLRAQIRGDNHDLRRRIMRERNWERRTMRLENWLTWIGAGLILLFVALILLGKVNPGLSWFLGGG